MAEEPITKWWAVGAKDEVVARKYLSYLHKHSMFGGHVGLNKRIRNDNPNRSLDSARGMYDMLEVYTLSGTSCEVGTVVNFKTDDDNNVEGDTFVYPVTDTSKPMGYMITEADPDVYGICVVNGILEVPLNYEKGATLSDDDYKDYVEYDLETGTFNFADTGYPVYNVYQDVDGDWIAIILWGKGAGNGSGDGKGDEYKGSFAVSIDHYDEEVPNKMWINCKDGNIFVNDIFKWEQQGFVYTEPDTSMNQTDELLGNISLSTGESLWLAGYYVETEPSSSVSYLDAYTDFFDLHYVVTTGEPIATTGLYINSDFVKIKIAENDKDAGLIQLQYGDFRFYRFKAGERIELKQDTMIPIHHPTIEISSPYIGPFDLDLYHVEALKENNEIVGMSGGVSVFDSTYIVPVTPSPYAGKVVVGTSQTKVYGIQEYPFVLENDLVADVYLYKEGNNYSFAILGRSDTQGLEDLAGKFYVHIGAFNVSGDVLQLQYGDIVQPQDSEGSSDLQDLVISQGVIGATVGITRGEHSAVFKGDGSVEVTKIRRYATAEEREQWGERSAGIAGSSSRVYKGAGWRGIYHLYDGSVMTEVSETATFSWNGREVEVEYPLIVPSTTDAELDTISRYMSGLLDEIPVSIRQKAQTWAQNRINEGKSTFYNGNGEAGDEDDALRNVDDKSIIILGFGQEIQGFISGNTAAYIGLTGSHSFVPLRAGPHIYFDSEFGEDLIISCSDDSLTGSSTFHTPPYSSLAITGETIPDGLGHTFVFPVTAGDVGVGFFDDGGCAKAVWTNIAGTTTCELESGVMCDVPDNKGWIRVSVIDDGLSSGSCLSIEDAKGNLPIYKYGSFGTSLFVYNGSFKVTCTANTVAEGETPTYTVTITDGCGRSTINNQYAGFVVEGTGTGSSTQISVAKKTFSSCSEGDRIYLVHTSSGYDFVTSLTSSHDFALLIGYIENGKAVQVQFGDVTVPSRNLVVENPATGTVSVGVSGGSNKVKFIAGENVTLTGDTTNRTITIKATGSSTTVTGLGYPNYSELGAIPSTVPNAQGITFLIPVQKGHSISYYTTGSPTVIARYAPCVGESGNSFYLSKGSGQTTDADGWVRISVFDDGSTPNDCLLYRDNGNSFPLYKYKSADGGGYGGYGGGGGSVNAPNWSKTESTQVLITPSNNNPYTTTSAGWVYACARVTNGDAHILINGAEFKVASARGSGNNAGGSICIPVRSGAVIQWEASNYDEAFAAFYPT